MREALAGLGGRIRAVSAWRVLVAPLLVVALVVAGCGGGGDGATTADDGGSPTTTAGTSGGAKPELTIGMTAEFENLNPAKDGARHDSQVVRSLTNAPLIHMNPDGELTSGGPALTESYEYVGDDNTTFKMTLRPDARFSDGTPVTATAVKEWLTYFPTESGPYSSQMQIDSIETPDRRTVVLHLAEPNAIVPWLLSEVPNWGAVSSPKAIAEPRQLSSRTFGAGPYTVDPEQSASGSQYTLVPNEHYFDQEAIRFSKVVVRVIGNPTTMVQAYKTGQVDVAIGDPTAAPSAESASGTVMQQPSDWAGYSLLDLSGSKLEALADVRVRQALNYAIDREAIAQGLLGAYGTPSSQVITSMGLDPELQDLYPYDPDKARSLLAEAGYADGFKLQASTSSSIQLDDQMSQAIAKYLNEVGVQTEVVQFSSPSQYIEKGLNGTYPAVQIGGSANPMPFLYAAAFAEGALLNPLGFEDPTLAKLNEEANRSDDPDAIWQQMMQRITDQAYFVPAVVRSEIWYVSDKVGGVEWETPGFAPFAVNWYPQ